MARSREIVLRPAAGIRPEKPRWLWAGLIPLGAISLLAGREGLGKSTLLVEISARLTRGELDGDLKGEPANVVIASAEDSPASTLVPRLIAAGADLDRVQLLDVVVNDTSGPTPGALTLPDDTEELGELLRAVGARFLALDPLVSYLSGDVNAHRDQHVRRVLGPLTRLADDLRLAIAPGIHLNKGETTDVLTRVGGSVGLTAGPRSVLVMGSDPEDPDGEGGPLRVLAHAKCNVGPRAPSLSARIETRVIDVDGEAIETSRIVLLGESRQSARDLLTQPASGEERTERDEAVAFLRAELAGGSVAAKAMRAAAADAGIAQRTLDRAKKAAGARSQKLADGSWAWELISTEPTGDVGDVALKTPSGDLQKIATKDAKDATAAEQTFLPGAATDLPLATDDELAEVARSEAKLREWDAAGRSTNGAENLLGVNDFVKAVGLMHRYQLTRLEKRGEAPEPDEIIAGRRLWRTQTAEEFRRRLEPGSGAGQ